jgi:hypothetical protein
MHIQRLQRNISKQKWSSHVSEALKRSIRLKKCIWMKTQVPSFSQTFTGTFIDRNRRKKSLFQSFGDAWEWSGQHGVVASGVGWVNVKIGGG